METVLRHARRVVIAVIGATIILLGLAMFVLPGPGIVTVLLGLALLATEFVWARQLLKHARTQATALRDGGWRRWSPWKRTGAPDAAETAAPEAPRTEQKGTSRAT